MAKSKKVSTNNGKKDQYLQGIKTEEQQFSIELLSSTQRQGFCADLSNDFLNWLATRKLSDLMVDEAIISMVLSTLTYQAIQSGMRRFFIPLLHAELERLRSCDLRIEQLMSPYGQELLRDLVASPELLSGTWIHKSLQHRAFHELMASLLYHTLCEFNVQVNPFFSRWGLPSLLKKSAPLGMLDHFGVGSKVIDTIKKEYEKQLEPQIKNFLALFTSKALDHVITFITNEKHKDLFTDLRRDGISRVYREKFTEVLDGLNDDRETRLMNTFVELASHYLSLESTRLLIEEEMRSFFSINAGRTFEEFLASFSLDVQQVFSHLESCIRPVLTAYVQSPSFQLLLERHVCFHCKHQQVK